MIFVRKDALRLSLMAHVCRQITGSVASCTGWVGVIIATATNDWVRTCDYTVATCIRMDELGSRGLWAECVISPALYHCVALNQILTLPGEREGRRGKGGLGCFGNFL